MREFVRTLVSRVNGLSTPIGGISWSPPANERNAALSLIALFEDRRVLFNPSRLEVAEHCVESVREMRRDLSAIMRTIPHETVVEDPAKAAQAACRAFLDKCGQNKEVAQHGLDRGHWASWVFLPAIGELRAQIGQQLAILSEFYSITVKGDLRTILPPEVQE